MSTSIFASKAELGQQYVTKSGIPVTVLERGIPIYGKQGVRVRDDMTGNKTVIYEDQLLWPYDKKLITKEAIEMSKIAKAGKVKKEKGADRGARKTGEGIVLFRVVNGVETHALFHGGILTVKGKDYMTMKEAAAAIAGKKVEYPHSYFGLKTEPNIGLGKEVIKGLEDAAKEVAKKEAAAKTPAKKASKRAKKAKETDDEDDEKTLAKTAGEVVAKVFGKGRK